MELSPLEIRSQKFSKKFKGYDITEVENFLDFISKDLEKLYDEFYNLKEELVKKNQEIKEYKEKDKLISDAILMVRSIGDDIKTSAKIEAQSIRNNAIGEAKRIINDAYAKYSEISMNINELLNKRTILIGSIKGLLSTNISIIEQEENKRMDISFKTLADALQNIDYKNNSQKTEEISNKDNNPSPTDMPTLGYPKDDDIKTFHEGGAGNSQNGQQKEVVGSAEQRSPAASDHNSQSESNELEKLLGDVNKFDF